jgi:hypothetical protein
MIGAMQEYETSQQRNDSDWFISTSINDYYPEMFSWCIGEYDPIISVKLGKFFSTISVYF